MGKRSREKKDEKNPSVAVALPFLTSKWPAIKLFSRHLSMGRENVYPP